jgi:hypothetical protein
MLWTSAFYVPEQFRNTLVGVMIVLKMQTLHRTIGACGVSQMALPVFQKLKWLDFKQPRFMLMRRSRALVERYLGSGLKGAVATKAADAGLLVHRAALSGFTALRTRGLTAQSAAQMPAELDAKLRETTRPVAVLRSAAWINWLLTESFERDPTLRKGLYLVRGAAGDVAGYFLLKMRLFETASHRGFKNVVMGSMLDWMSYDRERLTESLIALLAIRELGKWQADAVEICTDDPAMQKSLRRLGFLRVGELHTLVRSVKPDALCERYPDQKDWRLRPADGDNFFM